MAELIDKKSVLKDIASWAIGGNPEEPEMVRIDEIVTAIGSSIDELPTTTEAEIRNKAIDEFTEEVKKLIKKYYKVCPFGYTDIDEIAEQMKVFPRNENLQEESGN